jgi:hypothetical protein
MMATAETAFTPGPWLQGTGSGGGATTFVYEDDGTGQQCRAIAACTLDYVERPFREREANARLIATAPKLYEALLTLRGVIDAAGIHNLSNGVQLGQTSWAVKCTDAMALANDALLEACPAETLAESRA